MARVYLLFAHFGTKDGRLLNRYYSVLSEDANKRQLRPFGTSEDESNSSDCSSIIRRPWSIRLIESSDKVPQ